MNREAPDKTNYDVVSVSRAGQAKRSNYIQDAYHIDKNKISVTGQFIRVFSDMFLKKEVGSKAYF